MGACLAREIDQQRRSRSKREVRTIEIERRDLGTRSGEQKRRRARDQGPTGLFPPTFRCGSISRRAGRGRRKEEKTKASDRRGVK